MPVRTSVRPAAGAVCAALCASLLLPGCSSAGGGGGEGPGTGRAQDSPAAEDLNSDGYDDLVTVVRPRSRSGETFPPERLVVVLGSAGGLHVPTATVHEAGFFGVPLHADLDGDGFTDLAVQRGDGGAGKPVRTVVLRGGPHGPADPRPVGKEGFAAGAVGDFDCDGNPDLLDDGHGGRGDPAETVREPVPGAVLYGPFDEDGAPARTAPFTADLDGYASPRHATTGDFDGDGCTDAVLQYYFDAEQDDSAPEGLRGFTVRSGGKEGLVPDEEAEGRLDSALAGTLGEDPAAAFSAGDADGDGIDDLFAGVPAPVDRRQQPQGGPEDPGSLRIVHGSRAGLGGGRPVTALDQAAPGVPGDPQGGDGFGAAALAGDVTGDGRPDLVVATPYEDRGNGRLTLLPGTADGIPDGYGPDAPQQPQAVDLDTPGVPGTHNPYGSDRFAPLGPLLDVDGDGHADVVASAPGYGHGRTGGFWVLRGTDDGLSIDDVQHFTPADLGIDLQVP
ncbi:FG-GAP repeat protein [Streptomyces thermolineatus]|uniref:FG-GAP repeat protein n=1 Tax=Streptomyces thermolineatus TaxID=44033 RepID=A0ABN3MP72_9ACTN